MCMLPIPCCIVSNAGFRLQERVHLGVLRGDHLPGRGGQEGKGGHYHALAHYLDSSGDCRLSL